jgi:REP element-mobilizing transposase RayT
VACVNGPASAIAADEGVRAPKTRHKALEDLLMASRGWYIWGYLPHYDDNETTQFVTYRLADAVPADRLQTWVLELRHLPESEGKAELRERVERYLDAGEGEAHMRRPQCAALAEEVLLAREGEDYDLRAWVVMPNHVHALFLPHEGCEVGRIVQAWKSVSARRLNALLGRRGQLWQEDYFDRFIRDAAHFERVLGYIEWNPARAGLCELPEDWPFGSAGRRGSR